MKVTIWCGSIECNWIPLICYY